MIFITPPLSYRAKQFHSRAKAEAIVQGDAPPVLYLRPFEKESDFEEKLAKAVRSIGPMIAIGKPGENLPHLGAARTYPENDKWKSLINTWLIKAKLVIYYPGNTDGIWWEMEQIYENVEPDRLLIIIAELDPKYYNPFINKIREVLKIEFPDLVVRKEPHYKGHVEIGFFEFGKNWQCHFLPLRSRFFRANYASDFAEKNYLNYTLKPILHRLIDN
jgi:hypothetical protein